MSERTLDDLGGWSNIRSVAAGFPEGQGYYVFLSPDEKRVCQVNAGTEEVLVIVERDPAKLLYVHPFVLKGMELENLTEEERELATENFVILLLKM